MATRRPDDEEFGDEIQAHLELETDRLVAEGMTPDEARAAAWRAFGNVTQARERYYESRRVMWIDDLRTDVRHARQMLFRHPGFALVAVLTLAFGIGANATIFSVVHGILLRPLPFKDADRLVRIAEIAPTPTSTPGPAPARAPAPGVASPASASSSASANAAPNAAARANSLIAPPPPLVRPLGALDVAAFQAQTRTLSQVSGGHQPMLMTMTGSDGLIRVIGARASASLLSMLGARAGAGRVFDARDERANAEPAAIISHAMWQRHFGGAADVIGKPIILDGRNYAIVGVMTRDFQFLDRYAQFWLPQMPATAGPATRQRLALTARLKDGVSLAAAIAEVNALIPRLRGDATQVTATAPARFTVVPLLELQVAPIRPVLYVLAAAVGLVLLIACVNVANLLLARTAARQHEIAVRRALGASRGRLIRAAMTESIMLALIGGAAGIALALGGVRVLRTLGVALAPRDMGPGFRIPRIEDIGIDAPVLIFTAALALIAAILTGLAPALRQSRALPIDALRSTTGSPVSGFNLMRRHGIYGLLVIAEIGMAVTLFVGAALLIHSFVKLSRVDPGYDPSGVITFRVTLPGDRGDDQRKAFAADLAARFRELPGVTSAAFAESLPTVRQGRLSTLSATAPAAPLPKPAVPQAARERVPGERPDTRLVSRDYLKTMGIRVVRGRGFEDRDGAGQPPVMLINQALVRTGFLGANPIGTRIYASGSVTFDPRILDATRGAPGPWEIVGIVDDVHQDDLGEEASPQIFVDYRQLPGPSGPPGAPLYFAVRTDAANAAAAATAAVTSNIRPFARQLDPLALVEAVEPMTQLVASSIARPRFFTTLMGVFAALAVALAAIGIYGVMAYAVVRRTREIGIRMALGAGRARVLRLVLGQSLMLTTIGIISGLMGAAAATRYLEGFLFGLTPLDPATFAVASLAFAAIATIAALVPARRAARVDPLISLRAE